MTDETPERRRVAKAKPWDIGSLLPWSVAATFGDPVLLLLPVAMTVFGIVALLGIGATSAAECSRVAGCPAQILVPFWSLPPFDAYQDAGAIGLATGSAPVVWLLRGAALLVRTTLFGVAAHLSLQRAHNESPDLGKAAAGVRTRLATLATLELVAFGAFGIPLVLGQGSLLAPGRPVSQLGATIGLAVLVNAFLAAFETPNAWAAVGTGLERLRKRPLGHLALCVLATAASNGVYWLATAGEAGRPRDLTLALYALVHAVVATVFLVAFARRWRLLYQAN